MRRLWMKIEGKGWTKEEAKRRFLIYNSMIYGLSGLAIWLLISRFALCTIEWAICFVGYPGFFVGYLGGFLFLCKEQI